MKTLVKHLEVVKFIAQGNFSVVYETRSTKGVDERKSYALRRFWLRVLKYLHTPLASAVHLVLLSAYRSFQSTMTS